MWATMHQCARTKMIRDAAEPWPERPGSGEDPGRRRRGGAAAGAERTRARSDDPRCPREPAPVLETKSHLIKILFTHHTSHTIICTSKYKHIASQYLTVDTKSESSLERRNHRFGVGPPRGHRMRHDSSHLLTRSHVDGPASHHGGYRTAMGRYRAGGHDICDAADLVDIHQRRTRTEAPGSRGARRPAPRLRWSHPHPATYTQSR